MTIIHKSPHLSLFTVSVFTFPSISRDLKNPYHLPFSLTLFSLNLYPHCFNVYEEYFLHFLNYGGDVLTFRLRFVKNNLYALSILSATF